MSSLLSLASRLGHLVGEPPLPTLEYVGPVMQVSEHTLRETKRQIRQWAAEGDAYAIEALELLNERA